MSAKKREIDGFEVSREDCDVFTYRFPSGVVTGRQIEDMVLLEKGVWKDGGTLYFVVVLGKNLKIGAGALSISAQALRGSPPRVTAYVVQNFLHRVAMEFLVRALRGLGIKIEAKVFEDEAAAMAWILRKKEGRPSRTSVVPKDPPTSPAR